MKKFLLSALGTLPLLFLNVFATQVSLSLFQDGFSLLDKLLLCGIGIILIGFILLIIAFFKKPSTKKEKPVDSPFDVYLDEDASQSEDEPSMDEYEDDAEPEDESEELPNAPAEAMDVEPEAEAEPVVPIAEEPDLEEAEEGTIYPKLILTHTQTNDFVILPLYPETTVGRKSENDLVLSDVTVSGLHCKIINQDGFIYVIDEESTNGTFINGERLTEKTQLHHGDKLAIGKQEFNVSVSE